MKPVRIQLRRTKGWRMPPNTVKVDRSSLFGNPFSVSKGKILSGKVGERTWRDAWFVNHYPGIDCRTKAEAVAKSIQCFTNWINHPSQQTLKAKAVLGLRGKNLACWCRLDEPCHADVLLEIANK